MPVFFTVQLKGKKIIKVIFSATILDEIVSINFVLLSAFLHSINYILQCHNCTEKKKRYAQ